MASKQRRSPIYKALRDILPSDISCSAIQKQVVNMFGYYELAAAFYRPEDASIIPIVLRAGKGELGFFEKLNLTIHSLFQLLRENLVA